MDYSDLFHASLKDASARFKEYSEKDLDSIEDFVKSQNPRIIITYARLLVYRRDSQRLLALMDNQNLMVCEACCRFLKISSIRNDLMCKLNTEEKFLSAFNSSCQMIKQVLLEVLAWNADHPENCLADRLYKNPNLMLSPQLRKVLLQALSLELCVDEGYTETRYCKRHHKELEVIVLKRLYMISTDLKNGKYKDDLSTAYRKSSNLLPLIKRPYLKTQIDGQDVYLFNVLLDIWSFVADNNLIQSFMSNLNKYKEYFSDYRGVTQFKQSKFRGSRMIDFLNYYLLNSPYFIVKRLDLIKYSHFWTLGFTLIIIQACRAFKDEELNHQLVSILVASVIQNYNNKIWKRIRIVLTDEEFSLFLDQLLDKLLQTDPNSSLILFDNVNYILEYLWKYVPLTNPKLIEVMELLKKSEVDVVCKNTRFLRFFQQEVPFNFTYNMLTKDKEDMFTTVRKFESYICVKGSSLLNQEELFQRVFMLNSIVEMAIYSRDVRCVLRCLTLITGMEAKYTDLSICWSDHRELFSPDSLGLSSLSIQQSGSEEVAKICRQKIVDTLLSWVQQKKGVTMVGPLLFFILYMYFYASEYPEYEDTYCEMMRPFVSYLVNKKLQWDDMNLSDILISVQSERQDNLCDVIYSANRLSDLELPERKRHLIYENFMIGKAKYLPKKDSFGAHGLILYSFLIPHNQELYKEMAYKPLSMILSFLNDENAKRLYVTKLLAQVIHSSIIKLYRGNVVTQEQEIPNTNMIFKTATETKSYFVDFYVIKKLFWDMTIPYQPYFTGYSALQALMAIEPSLEFLNSFLDLTDKVVDYSYGPKSKIPRIVAKEISTLQQLKKITKKVSFESQTSTLYRPAIEESLKTFAQSTNFINNVEFSEGSLQWIYSTMKQYNLFSILNSTDNQVVMQHLSSLSDSDLLLISSLTALRLQIVFQGAVMVISMNLSANPMLTSILVNQVKTIHKSLLEALTAQVLVNNEIHFRGLTPEQTCYKIKTLLPFLHAFLKSITDKTTQTIKEMQDLTPVEGDANVLEVSLDFYDNTMIGRFVEILVYSRKTKDFFGKVLYGIVPFTLLLDYPTIIHICRRLLLTTRFVPLAESIVNECLMCASAKSDLVEQLLSVVLSASRSMTTATILFVLRLSQHPVIEGNGIVYQTISKLVTYVVENKFDAASVYIKVISWLLNQVITCKSENVDKYLENLKTLSFLDTKGKAARVVFNIVTKTAGCLFKKSKTDSVEELSDIIRKILHHEDQSRSRMLLQCLEEMIILFDYTQSEDISNQCRYLINIESSVQSEEFITKCKHVLEEAPNINVAIYILLYLFTVQPATAVDLFVTYNNSLLANFAPDDDKDSKEQTDASVPNVNVFKLLQHISMHFPATLLIRFVSQLPTTVFPFQAVAPVATSLVKSIGDKRYDSLRDVSFDVDAFVSDVERVVQPWMLDMIDVFIRLFTFSKDMKLGFYNRFLREKTDVSALLTYSTNDDDVKRTKAVMSWVTTNCVSSLYWIIP